MSAQAKAISEVVKDFEQSLQNLRPSTRRVYVAGARAAIRAASLEPWQSTSLTDLLASIGKFPVEKNARISPFLDFLGGPKQAVSDFGLGGFAELGDPNNRQKDAHREKSLYRQPTRHCLDGRDMRGTRSRISSKMAGKLPRNCGKRSSSVGHADPGAMFRACLALLAGLERAPGQAGPTPALP